MPNCPKCGREINHLHYYEEHKHTFELDEKGKPTYRKTGDVGFGNWECPECMETLFTDGDEQGAIDFLKGKEAKNE